MALRREGPVIPITTLSLDGHTIRLQWKHEGETYHYRLESEEEKTCEIRQAQPCVYLILSEGRSYEARVDGSSVSINGGVFDIELVDPRRRNRGRSQLQGEGRQNIAASMPGKVVRVLIAEGDQVEAGQGLVVVEAMKMQNELKAGRSGKVVALAAVAGATVNAGEILATIE
jgi:biotin carboxyl carrier protein